MGVPRELLEIRLFGGFSVRYDGKPLPPLPSRSARLLFAWLALHAGRPQSRTLLTDRFWPDMTEARARRRLSHALWQVQDCLSEMSPEHTYLVTQGDEVLFDAATTYWLDVEEFESRLDRIDNAGAVDDAGLRNLRHCVELYQGDLLAGSYESWVVEEQDRLRQRYATALTRLVDAAKKRGNFEEALTFAQRLTHQVPLREDVHREVMRLCVLLGQHSQALEQYERCRSVLEEELGTEPSAETRQLRDRIAETRDVGVSRRPPVEQLVSRKLVGRDDQRVALVDQLERTLAGATAMVFVEGEPGIGKSQLLAQAADDARWRGFTVLWGECAGASVPYAAIRDALTPHLDAVRVAQLRALVEPVWLQEAGRLLEPLAAYRDATPAKLDGTDGAERMREALVRVLTGFAAMEPVMLVIEDAQRADQETLELLRAMGRHAADAQLLAVLTFRDADARHDDLVWTGLRAVDRDSRPVRIKLDPLSAFETAALLREVLGATDVPAKFVESIHRESGGNPLYALELLRALRDAGTLRPEQRERLGTVDVPVTDGLRTIIDDRLDYLDASATAVVKMSAVFGVDCSIEMLRVGCDLEQRALAAALGELVRRNLLELTGEHCRFTHAATRRVVLDRIDDDEGQTLHAAAAHALEELHPDRVEALAGHFQRAQVPDKAVAYLRKAAERSMDLHAYATAANHLAAAVALSEQTVISIDTRFDLFAQYEHVLGVLGRRDEQAAALDRMLQFAGDDISRVIDTAVRRATFLGHVDDFAEATAVAEHAVAQAGEDHPEWRGRAKRALGQVLSWSGDNERAARVLVEAAQDLAELPREAVHARFALGAALRATQQFAHARRELTLALELAESHDHQVGIVQVLGALADVHAETGDTDEAIELHTRAVAQARALGYRHREGVGLVNLGTVQLATGNPVAALDAYDQAVDVFEGLGNRRGEAMVQLNRSWLRHRWFGQDADAERDAMAAHRYFAQVGNHGLAAVCLETLAGIARHREQFDRAAEHLADAARSATAAGDQRAEVQITRGTIELALATGDISAAEIAAAQATERVDALGLVEFAADIWSLRAWAAAIADSSESAVDFIGRAVACMGQCSEPHRVHHRAAVVAETIGNEREALEQQRAAYSALLAALDGLDERAREKAIDGVPEHAAIAAAGQTVTPKTVVVRMAQRDAPRGRALTNEELTEVSLLLAPALSTREERQEQLVAALEQIEQQGAQATVHDLAAALNVSTSTVRRDLRELRQRGFDVQTRGTGTG